MRLDDYAIRIEPLPHEEGGGFLVTVPDLPGCVADGETIDAALAEAHDAFNAWASAERRTAPARRERRWKRTTASSSGWCRRWNASRAASSSCSAGAWDQGAPCPRSTAIC